MKFRASASAPCRCRSKTDRQYVGLCHVSCTEVDEARAIVPITAVQNRLNPHDLTCLSAGIVQACNDRGIAFLASAPVGGLRQRETIGESAVLREVGAAHDATPFEVALAWALGKAPNVIPIPGATRVESVRSSARATRLKLTDTDRRAIARVLEVPLGFPDLRWRDGSRQCGRPRPRMRSVPSPRFVTSTSRGRVLRSYSF